MKTRDTIVVGASAGGVDALVAIAAALPERLPAAVLVALHIGAHPSVLPELMQKAGRLPAHHARDGERIAHGNIYVAPPDLHMVIEDDVVRTIRGPKQNFSRPAIDPLFRSAAVVRGPRVIGAVLTGHLDDGTAGLAAVQACGGIAMVQDPEDAHAPDMPRNAMRGTVPDYILPIDKLASTIAALAGSTTTDTPLAPPPELMAENDLMLEPDSIERMAKVGRPTGISCPECGGTLWRLEAPPPTRYRCHTGHAFGAETLGAAGDHVIERSLWQAVRALHEKKALSTERAEYHMSLGEPKIAQRFVAQARDAAEAARALEQLLYKKDRSS
ncbi:chemotaxis protein CheB [Trinickia diaoshuihuensis]|uniref:chemotaxis protein CheB n=1 Tax=Trinickia diaoshuihuensis TaxID=2292265 RepID=UPI000E231DE4|nr:chemotaxis protein CheB [Trinickia diaoshuihuensis]